MPKSLQVCSASLGPLESPLNFPDQIKRHLKESQQHTYTLLLVPRASAVVSQILEDEGVLGDVRISTYDLQFIPIAEDVLSLEANSSFSDLWVVCPFPGCNGLY